jgi:hypothetical protein
MTVVADITQDFQGVADQDVLSEAPQVCGFDKHGYILDVRSN